MLSAALALLLAAQPGAAPAAAPAVVVVLALDRRPNGSAEERVRVRDLEYELMARLAAAAAGELVRDEWPDGACRLVLSAPDARRAWEAVEPAVRAYGPRPGSFALLRSAEGAEERIELAR